VTKPKNEAVKVGPLRVAPHIRDGEASGKWMIDLPPHVSPDGKRKRVFLATKAAATAEAKRLLRELQLEGAIRGGGPKLAGVTFGELVKKWLEGQADRVATGKKRPRSLESDAQRMVHLLAHFGEMDIQRIVGADLAAYQKKAIAKRAPATVNADMRLLKTVMLFAADKDLIGKVPRIDPIPEPRKRLDLPTMPEVLSILSHLPTHTALLVRFLAETGCRKGEAFNLDWRDVRKDDQIVIIRPKDGGWTPKTAHSHRDIPVSKNLMDAMMLAKNAAADAAQAEGVEASPFVFPGRGGGRTWDFRKALVSAIVSAGVRRDDVPMHITPHMLRKAFISWQKARGLDDAILQPHVGHAPGSRVTAQSYTHLSLTARRGAALDLGVANDLAAVDGPAAPRKNEVAGKA
jgi:integrase